MPEPAAALIRVTAAIGSPRARLTWPDGTAVDAMIGREGLVPRGTEPKEGDWATPQGRFALRQVFYRPDREAKPRTALPVHALRPDDGWCDDPGHVLYNRPVRRPFEASHEEMWREDRAYDLIVVLDFNLTRPEPGRGSAIFFHLTKTDDDPPPTAGCVAISPAAMRRGLAILRGPTVMEITADQP